MSASAAKKLVLCAMLVASVFIGLSYVCIAVKADSKLFITLKNRHIERISSASLLNFYTEYALKGVPVIVTDYASVYENMTIQNILKYCGDKEVHEATTNGTQDFLQRVPPNVPLRYRDSWPSLFIGRNNSFGGLHVDVFGSAFWQYVIDGKKEWHIMSPVADFLADYSFFERNGVESNVVHFHGVVNAGEFIFIPGNCPHQVKNIGNTVAIAGNVVSTTEMNSMRKEISGSDREYYMELQNTLLLETFDRSIDPSRGDMSYAEYKEQYKDYDQSIYIGYALGPKKTKEHTSTALSNKDSDDDAKLRIEMVRFGIEHLEVLSAYTISDNLVKETILHIFIINLKHRKKRYELIYNTLQKSALPMAWSLDINRVEASTGDEDFVTTYDDWKTNDTVHDGKVTETETFWNRDVTKGEIGCYVSHVKTIVEEIAAYQISDNKNHYFLMLEDDANFDTKNMFFDLKKHLYQLPRDWDLFYLGYVFLNDEHKVINEFIYKAGYTYQAHAYMVTQEFAKKISKIENLYSDVVAYDEFLNVIHNQHPREDIKDLYGEDLNFSFYAARTILAWQRKVKEGGDSAHDSDL
eukprot:g2140.t1